MKIPKQVAGVIKSAYVSPISKISRFLTNYHPLRKHARVWNGPPLLIGKTPTTKMRMTPTTVL